MEGLNKLCFMHSHPKQYILIINKARQQFRCITFDINGSKNNSYGMQSCIQSMEIWNYISLNSNCINIVPTRLSYDQGFFQKKTF